MTFVRRLGEAAALGGGECGPCPDFASNTVAFALQLSKHFTSFFPRCACDKTLLRLELHVFCGSPRCSSTYTSCIVCCQAIQTIEIFRFPPLFLMGHNLCIPLNVNTDETFQVSISYRHSDKEQYCFHSYVYWTVHHCDS